MFAEGYQLTHFPLPNAVKDLVQNEQWVEVDAFFQQSTSSSGDLFRFLKTFHDFSQIEFIISIRDAQNEWEEDGIWHDDGTRVFAFSLSLTENASGVKGGMLGIRRRGEETFIEVPTPEFGEMILFLTGVHGFEHKIHQVTQGKRVMLVGWCS